jgi:hypothetical protein
LKSPAKASAGVISHTKSVINEQEFNHALHAKPVAQTAPPATASTAPPPTAPRAVKVTKPQAQAFASWTTRAYQNEGRIPTSQRFRLPKTTEAPSPKVWREDDTPASPADKKPFGLVLVDTPTDSAPPPAIIHTPEGIPVRNLPEGESALKKNGPDKPLWKRPE